MLPWLWSTKADTEHGWAQLKENAARRPVHQTGLDDFSLYHLLTCRNSIETTPDTTTMASPDVEVDAAIAVERENRRRLREERRRGERERECLQQQSQQSVEPAGRKHNENRSLERASDMPNRLLNQRQSLIVMRQPSRYRQSQQQIQLG